MADKVIPPSAAVEEQPPVSISPDNEKQRIPSPVDLHLIVLLWILFILSFIDRINLGNVRVLGILKELHLTGNRFKIALQVFFVPYILLEILSNTFLRKFSLQHGSPHLPSSGASRACARALCTPKAV